MALGGGGRQWVVSEGGEGGSVNVANLDQGSEGEFSEGVERF